jgi:hypothetical protein
MTSPADPDSSASPETVVQRQLDAYNAHDLDAWVGTYAPDARQFQHPAQLLAEGHAQIRARMVERFTEPDLHARLIHRMAMGTVVVDHEEVTRNFPEGRGRVQMICVYEVRDGRIRAASFALGEKTID